LDIEGMGLVVVFLDSSFDEQAPEDRQRSYETLQTSAKRAGLQGDVAAVWQDAKKRTRFLAQPQQHPFFQVVNFAQLRAQAASGQLAVESEIKG
jgi:hypothetical protein